MPSIFISYRISDSADITGRIYDHLERRFGAGEVFRDALSIRGGNDYRDDIHQALNDCRVLVVVIGPGWLNAVDAKGDRRLHQPDDWVRREIETALGCDIPILPLLVNNAPHSAAEDLPDSLKPLAYRQSLPLRSALEFQDDMDRLIERLGDLVPATRAIVAVPHNLPRSGATAFVGRDTELGELHGRLTQDSQLAITALRGMGGIGKTELALRYALHHLKELTYPGSICWLQAKEQNIGTEIVNFALVHLGLTPPDGLELPAQVAYVWNNWPTTGDVLVVIDDVAGPDSNAAYANLKPYLPPPDSRFRVLLTTRLQFGTSISTYAIDVLSAAAALDLLKSLVGPERIDADLDTAKALCHWLGYLPLGLELVGRFLARKPGWTLAKMQQQLNEKRLEAKALGYAQADMTTAHESLAAAFELSWQDLAPEARELAYRLSLYALAPIVWKWLETWYDGTDPDDLEDWRDEGLASRSLLEVEIDGEAETVQLHQIIREFFRAKLEQWHGAEGLKRSYCEAMVQVAKGIPQAPTREQIVAVTPVIPHLAEAATTWQQWLDDESLAWPFIGLGWFYQGQGAYGQAEPWRQDCLVVVRDRLGDDHSALATSLNNLAGLYGQQGRYSEAELLYRDALTLCQRLLGGDHPTVASSMNNLAHLYWLQGRYSEAEPLFRNALKLRQRLLGDDHLDVASSLNNLASLYESQGRYSEAETLLHDALTLRQRLLGDDHLDVVSSLNSVAHLYWSQGRYSEAEPLFRDALTMNQRLLGRDHPAVASSMNNLAALYESQGRYSEAETLLHDALRINQRLLGDDHPNTTTSLNNLADLYQLQGRYGEAEPLFHNALTLRQRLLGENHPDVASSLNNLADLYQLQGRYGEAEPLFHDALTLRQRLLGENHPDVASSLNNLAYLYRSQDRYGEAELLYRDALTLRERLLGNNHPDVAFSMNNLAYLYRLQGHYGEAELLYLAAISIVYQRLGENHPNTQTMLSNFVDLLQTIVAAGQTSILSDHPLTQALLHQVQGE